MVTVKSNGVEETGIWHIVPWPGDNCVNFLKHVAGFFILFFFWGIRNRRAQVHLLPNDYAGWGLLSTLMCVDQILRNYWLLWTSMNGLTEYWICMACFNWIWSTETIDRWSYVVKCWTWFLPYWNGNLRRQLIAVHWTWTPYMAESFSLSNRRRRTTTKTTFKHWTTAWTWSVDDDWLHVGLADDWKADQGPFKHYSQLHTNYNIRKIMSYSLIIQFTTTINILNIRFRTTVFV